MRVRYLRALGGHAVGEVVEQDTTSARWLLDRGYVEQHTASDASASKQQSKQASEDTSASKPEEGNPKPFKVGLDEDELHELTVVELRDLARERDLSVSGSKADLIERISHA